MVQNANTQLALKLVRESGQLQLGVYAIAPLNHIVVELSADHQPLYETQLTLKPGESWQQTLPENGVGRLTLKVKTAENQPLLDYQEHITQQTPLPEPAIAPALPEAIHNGDELYFYRPAPEQYNHASRYAGDYYRRAVEPIRRIIAIMLPSVPRRSTVPTGRWRNRCPVLSYSARIV